jgi:hypothetical protein
MVFEIDPVFESKFPNQTYKVRDPFNNTYNPAKVYKGPKNNEFREACEKAAADLRGCVFDKII